MSAKGTLVIARRLIRSYSPSSSSLRSPVVDHYWIVNPKRHPQIALSFGKREYLVILVWASFFAFAHDIHLIFFCPWFQIDTNSVALARQRRLPRTDSVGKASWPPPIRITQHRCCA